MIVLNTQQFFSKVGRPAFNKRAGDEDQPAEGKWWTSAPVIMAAGGAAGAGLGRYLIAPAVSRLLGLDPGKTKRNFMVLGGLAGILPGLLHGLVMRKLYGKFSERAGGPRTEMDVLRERMWERKAPRPKFDERPRLSLDRELALAGELWRTSKAPKFILRNKYDWVKKKSADSGVWDKSLWSPTFPVAQSLDEISNNPFVPPADKARMRMLVAEAGREQGIGRTGLASAGALMKALPSIVRHAVPTVTGALVVSDILGAPRRLKNTAVGSALVYSALKGFMSGNQ